MLTSRSGWILCNGECARSFARREDSGLTMHAHPCHRQAAPPLILAVQQTSKTPARERPAIPPFHLLVLLPALNSRLSALSTASFASPATTLPI
jgi:hypothetical protein